MKKLMMVVAILGMNSIALGYVDAGSGDPGGESDNGVSTHSGPGKSGALDFVEVDLTGGKKIDYKVNDICGADNPNGFPQGFVWSVKKKKNGGYTCYKVTFSNR